MATVHEIAPDVFRISTMVEQAGLGFNQFLVRDEKPLLFHTGLKAMFPDIKKAVATLIDPTKLAYISYSHFEQDECGSANEWLATAPQAKIACGFVAAMVNGYDAFSRPPQPLNDGETLKTGKFSFKMIATPQVPHSWDACMLFEEKNGTLFCSDLFHQNGKTEATTTNDILPSVREAMMAYNDGPFGHYMPWTPRTRGTLQKLAALKPQTLAVMHGAAYKGDGAKALNALADVMAEVCGK
ncbi:MAG: MBL fold metallo-hydrolase [Planctomycetes bacterium]|nr:MBL fold metallo-hydrolase [Planctomycetota bacterium]